MASSSAVLPIPAGPATTTTVGRPDSCGSRHPRSTFSSRSRPQSLLDMHADYDLHRRPTRNLPIIELRRGLKDVRRPPALMHAYVMLGRLVGMRARAVPTSRLRWS